MVLSTPTTEPYVVGADFFSSLVQKAERLEADAARDEIFATKLKDADHRRRHTQLVLIQRDHAAMLRDFLATVQIRRTA